MYRFGKLPFLPERVQTPEERAYALLRSVIPKEDRGPHILRVRSKVYDRTFVVSMMNGVEGNIFEMKDGVPINRWCAHPRGARDRPQADCYLGQYLALKYDTRKFLAKAVPLDMGWFSEASYRAWGLDGR